MNINPYESPRVAEPMRERPMEGLPGGDDSVRQLLVEIRNGQREMLELQREAVMQAREALVRTQRMRPFGFVMMAIAMVIMVAGPFWSIYRIRSLPTPATRVAPVPPRMVPAPLPVTKATEAGGDEGREVSR